LYLVPCTVLPRCTLYNVPCTVIPMPRIHTIHMGFDQAYLVVDEGVILIDGGAPGKIAALEKELARVDVAPTDIRLIVITHGHWDHIGSARAIRELTGAEIAMHGSDAYLLEEGIVRLSPGISPWGRLFVKAHQLFLPFIKIEPCDVDIRIGDEGMDLGEYGIPGKVVHTPGHSHGSLSVLLGTGQAFVGDLAMNRLPLRASPGLPIFAVDEKQVRDSWQKLIAAGATEFWPAHGKPFKVVKGIS